MAKHRTYSVEFKRQIAQEYLGGETLHGLAKRHDLSRNLVRICVEKYQAGGLDEDTVAADLRGPHCPRATGRQTGSRARVSKGSFACRTPAEKGDHVRHCQARDLSVAEGCRLMSIARSMLYASPSAADDDTAVVEATARICEDFEQYGWRRVRAALRQ